MAVAAAARALFAEVYVNGEQISSPTVLSHGDRLIIGANHVLRFSQPRKEEDHDDVNSLVRVKVGPSPSAAVLARRVG